MQCLTLKGLSPKSLAEKWISYSCSVVESFNHPCLYHPNNPKQHSIHSTSSVRNSLSRLKPQIECRWVCKLEFVCCGPVEKKAENSSYPGLNMLFSHRLKKPFSIYTEIEIFCRVFDNFLKKLPIFENILGNEFKS